MTLEFMVTSNIKELAHSIVENAVETDVREGTDFADTVIFELIKALDLEMAEWGFTKQLHVYFESELKKL